MAETGHFATLWKGLAERFKLEVDFLAGDWRRGAQPAEIEARLVADREHAIKAVMVVHNETSTGVTSRIHEIRKAVDRAKHPALLLVDTISSLGSIEYEHDAWGVDVTVSCSQKGLMLPPGLGFNAVSEKALLAAKTNQTSRSYWDWHEILQQNKNGSWPYTPATKSALWVERSDQYVDGRGAGQRVRPPSETRCCDTGCGSCLEFGNSVPRPARVFPDPNCCRYASGA
jgi:alanine-glyoxylate transaminase/serine-glyoxylate transaminase/serine-pyruvate transaminase